MTRIFFGIISLSLFLVAAHTTSIVDYNYIHRYLASWALLVMSAILGGYAVTLNEGPK
jgi:hypothetical protein